MNSEYVKDKSIDIYSLGSLLWEIMSERIPYSNDQNENILQLINRIREGHREKSEKDIPDIYKDLYEECWNGDSSKRPSINDVYERLLNIK